MCVCQKLVITLVSSYLAYCGFNEWQSHGVASIFIIYWLFVFLEMGVYMTMLENSYLMKFVVNCEYLQFSLLMIAWIATPITYSKIHNVNKCMIKNLRSGLYQLEVEVQPQTVLLRKFGDYFVSPCLNKFLIFTFFPLALDLLQGSSNSRSTGDNGQFLFMGPKFQPWVNFSFQVPFLSNDLGFSVGKEQFLRT